MREIQVGRIYQHFKGDCYLVEGIALDSETKRETVIYRALYGEGTLYVRDLEMFLSEVDKEKYPEVTTKYRFTLLEIDSIATKFTSKR